MIRAFADVETERVWQGKQSRRLPCDIQNSARRKLRYINRAKVLQDLRVPPGNRLEQLKGFTPLRYSVRINDRGSPFAGRTEARMMSGSRTITKDEGRLDNVHPGDILRHDFLIGSEISLADVAGASGINAGRLAELLDGKGVVDAATDLRLSRYFGISEGIFLALQNDFDLEEAKRALNGELDRIVPRAA
ncbi:addiction module HigA family antidote [Sphingomonas sp. UYAg733]